MQSRSDQYTTSMVSQVSHLNLATTIDSSAGSVVAEPLDECADSGAEIFHPVGYPQVRTHSDTSTMPCRMTPA